MTMLRFAQTCEAIAATTRKLEKTALVADYLNSLPVPQAAIAAIFFSGGPFASYKETTLQVGGSLLWRAIAELSGKSEHALTEIYRRHGDSGSVAFEALPPSDQASLSLTDVQQAFDQIAAARGPVAKSQLLRQLLEHAVPLEAKYIVKIINGDLRIGLKENLVEEGIAKAFQAPLDQVKRANMLLGDIGETLQLAAGDRLAEARMRLFHPIDFMLASPVESPDEALRYFENAAIEDKYDGIRAHAHVSNGEVRLFSRTRDEITESFPELPPALATLREEVILDGEIVAWTPRGIPDPCGAGALARETVAITSSPERTEEAREEEGKEKLKSDISAEPCGAGIPARGGRALPFSTLQQRLGRKKVTEKMMRDVPVAYLVFDIIYANGELLLDHPLRERAKILDRVLSPAEVTTTQVGAGAPTCPAERSSATTAATQSRFAFATSDLPPAPVLRDPVSRAQSAADVETLFAAARARGNEGLMIKDLESLYTPGRRGKSWLKMKRELATLDVVVTAVEYGHGKRIGVVSDYTFAVWNGDRLVNIGKAYSGLTDAEIAEMTKWFLAHVTRDQGLRLEVEPEIVLEVAFNNMMLSSRHESGYALRFPRITRLRRDKRPEDADTIETAREIHAREHRPPQ